ncbi:Transcription factor CBF/NF-Y/archaeal histone domain-containing protein [Plasmodiophora brassicae]|uniref:Transcription factor CBF/NF-Y/archaeal histone domain-containing protein n=1 Tax=Plasmodiophora brassicae TaxID=37360 RepID=A0A0G4J7M9_PLABS|nr:hypothetical protein PBRA_003021 [Plasmodiophora brassicae]SPQ95495.1 unnamed protein product [Plasmodiophora brassicae]
MENDTQQVVEVGRDHDRQLPIANINRLMRMELPESAKISRDAKEVVQECVSEFVGFVTSVASERLTTEKRKTVTGDDIIEALNSVGFRDMVIPLKGLLAYLRETKQYGNVGATSSKRKRSPDAGDTSFENAEPVADEPNSTLDDPIFMDLPL